MESSENVSTTYRPWRESEREHSIIRKSENVSDTTILLVWMEIAKPSKMFETQKINGNESIGKKNVVDEAPITHSGDKKQKNDWPSLGKI